MASTPVTPLTMAFRAEVGQYVHLDVGARPKQFHAFFVDRADYGKP